MEKENIKGKWQEIKGQLKTRWGKLTDDEITQIEGNRDILAGKLEQSYGHSKEEAKKMSDEFWRSVDEQKDQDREPSQERRAI